MPVHNWSRVAAAVFHDFHNVWIGQLRNLFNGGMLPSGFYAMSEQHVGRYITDVLGLHASPAEQEPLPQQAFGGVAIAEAPPKVRRVLSLSAAARTRRKTLTIRHVSGHRIVAMIEIVSPANKDRQQHVDELLYKLEDALSQGIHLLVVDLFPPANHDPHGLPGELWERLGDTAELPSIDEPLSLAAFVADTPVRAYFEPLAVGYVIPDMPLFLSPDHYVNTPLESTYQTTWNGTPEHWRAVLESR